MIANGARRSGNAIDVQQLDYQVSLRGITLRQLARQAGVPEATLSRARHGRRVSNSTLRRLSTALLQIPLMIGADMILAEPARNQTVPAAAGARTVQEVSRGSGTT